MNKFTIFNINIFTTNLFISLQFINLIYYYCNNFLDCDIKNKYFTRLKRNKNINERYLSHIFK